MAFEICVYLCNCLGQGIVKVSNKILKKVPTKL